MPCPRPPRITAHVALLFTLLVGNAAADEGAERLFALRVLPLFQEKCFPCHGDDPGDLRGAFDMRTRSAVLKGGESGEPSLVPSQPDDSPLYLAIQRDSELWSAMPPKENDRLTAAQREAVRQWIAAGAPWPSAARLAELARSGGDWDSADGVIVPTSGGLKEEWTRRRYARENLWAYQPLRRPVPPHRAGSAGNPVDAFIDTAAEKSGVVPAPLADRRTLLRRATLDLTGLPPTPEEMDSFLHDPAPDDEAFARVVDRLLASPHYGERWAQHWLDVVRYADSSGYANDFERGNAWRYRDYVVRAFNQDKPYAEFIREQLAGDELAEQHYAERTGESPGVDAVYHDREAEWLVAAGFLRMGPWELTGMEVPRIARQRFLDDVTDAVGQVFLGHMLQCARCHDHKFDPVPTRDYYSVQAVFATTQLAERQVPFLPCENREGFEERKYLEQRRQYYQQILQELDEQSIAAARKWYAEQQLDPRPFEDVLRSKGGKAGYNEIRNGLFRRKIPEAQIPPRHVGFTPQQYGLERVARKGLERLRWRNERYEPIALTVYSGRTPQVSSVTAPVRMPADRDSAGELEQTCILVGGDPFSPQDPVRPGALSAVERLVPFHLPEEASLAGRRLSLADWIASPSNPLTWRVMANRIWQGHFGRPLAGNPNNFGATGKKPTHPELLDWLAATLLEQGGSVKALHRVIMNSNTYRRSSRHPAAGELAQRDPEGHSYALFPARRMGAEEIRDAMLAVTGELHLQLGGIPARPEIHPEAALQPRMVMGTFAEAWQPAALPHQRHRRSLYALRLRGQRDPFLEVFNAPTPDLSCEARESSIVTPQVFALFNSEITLDRALALAERVCRDTTGEMPAAPGSEREFRAAAIRRAWRLLFGRDERPEERGACLAHWETMELRHRQLAFAPPEYPREVRREAVEENTGEKFTFVEPLEVYADFIPDRKMSDAGPELRGLAEVCLVLLNANEFTWID